MQIVCFPSGWVVTLFKSHISCRSPFTTWAKILSLNSESQRVEAESKLSSICNPIPIWCEMKMRVGPWFYWISFFASSFKLSSWVEVFKIWNESRRPKKMKLWEKGPLFWGSWSPNQINSKFESLISAFGDTSSLIKSGLNFILVHSLKSTQAQREVYQWQKFTDALRLELSVLRSVALTPISAFKHSGVHIEVVDEGSRSLIYNPTLKVRLHFTNLTNSNTSGSIAVWGGFSLHYWF